MHPKALILNFWINRVHCLPTSYDKLHFKSIISGQQISNNTFFCFLNYFLQLTHGQAVVF